MTSIMPDRLQGSVAASVPMTRTLDLSMARRLIVLPGTMQCDH